MNIRELNEAIDKVLQEDGNGLLKLSDNLINRLTFGYLGSEDKLPRFNSLEDLEEYIKSTNSFPDIFFYQDALFTVDEYDMEGEYLSYGCPQLDKGITVRTPDGRYNYKGNYAELEMEIEESDGWSYRFDLTYYLPKEIYMALYNKFDKESMKEDYSELKNDKSLDVYRKILNDNVKIDDYVFQDKKHVLVKFHNVTPKDRKQVIILDDKFEERLNKTYDKCRKVNESLKQTKSSKKSMKEDVNTVYVLIDNKVALNFEQDFNFAIDLLDADGLIKRAEELDKNFEQNAKEANLGSPLMNDVLYAIKVLRSARYFVLIKNVH